MSFHEDLFDKVLVSEEGSYAINILANLLGEVYSKYGVYIDTDNLVTCAIEMQADITFEDLGGVDEEDVDEDDFPSDYDSYDYEDE